MKKKNLQIRFNFFKLKKFSLISRFTTDSSLLYKMFTHLSEKYSFFTAKFVISNEYFKISKRN